MAGSHEASASESLDLATLVEDPSKISEVPHTSIAALLAQLGGVQVAMAARLLAVEDTPSGDDSLLTVDQAATRLGVSPDWLYRRTRKLPFVVRVGRHVRFSAHGIE